MTGPLPWEWCDSDLADTFADGLPPAGTASEPCDETVVDVMTVAANEQTEMAMVVGFSTAAVRLAVADTVLATKTLIWFVHPADLRALAACLGEVGGFPGRLMVGVFDTAADFVRLVEGMPLIAWSLCVLDPEPGLTEAIQHLRNQRLRAAYFCPDRILSDLVHLMKRGDRIAEGVPVAWWKDHFAGATALVVAAGPSLDRHLPFLREHAPHCIVVTVDVVHARLRDMGIRIDFAINVDSSDLIAGRLGSGAPGTVLVMPMDGNAEIDQRFTTVSYESQSAAAEWFLPPGRHAFLHGTNVGAATVGWAHHLGCAEIILIGHDLAFDKGRVYASAVSGREDLEQRNSVSLRTGQAREVAGNDGTTVLTDANFEAGIRDLGLISAYIAKRGSTVYNLNIGQAIGAAIPATQALPDGWRPRPRPPMPSEMPRNAIRGAADRLRRELPGLLQAYVARWSAISAEVGDAGELETYLRISDESELRIAQEYLTPFEMAHVLQLYRLGSTGTVGGRIGVSATVGVGLVQAVQAGAELVRRAVVEGHTPPEAPSVWNDRQRAFFLALRAASPVLREESLDRVVIPLIGRDWRFLRRLGVEAALAGVMDLQDALALVAHLSDSCPPALLAEALALCRIAIVLRADHALDLARDAGMLDPAQAVNLLAEPAWLAADAILALRAGDAADPEAAAFAAAAWPAGAPALVQALLAEPMQKRGGVALLGRLVGEGRLTIDDGIAARIIDSHPDVVAACDLLAPYQPRLGEATICAIADRFAAIGQHASAIEEAVRIRPLSALADRAYARLVRSLIELNRWNDIDTVLTALPGGYLRSGVLARALGAWFGRGRGTLLKLAEYAGLRPVRSALISEELSLAADQRQVDRPVVEAALRLVEESLQRPVPADEHAALTELVPALRRMREITA